MKIELTAAARSPTTCASSAAAASPVNPAFEGGRRSVSLRLAPGRYRFLCTVGDHAKLGMRGTLTVKG